LFHRVIETERSDTTKDTKDQIIDWLNETDIDDWTADEIEKTKDKTKRGKKD
jgi:hypothetical protein